jgi:hypothetical protein
MMHTGRQRLTCLITAWQDCAASTTGQAEERYCDAQCDCFLGSVMLKQKNHEAEHGHWSAVFAPLS